MEAHLDQPSKREQREGWPKLKGKRILADKATGKVERQVANPAQLRKVFAEYREAVRKDAEEKRYNRPEPLADAVVGVIH